MHCTQQDAECTRSCVSCNITNGWCSLGRGISNFHITSSPSTEYYHLHYANTFKQQNTQNRLKYTAHACVVGNRTTSSATARSWISPSPGNGFLRRLPAMGGGEGGWVKLPQHISSSRENSDKNSNGYTYVFWVKLSSSGTSDFVGRRNTNNFAGFTDTRVVPKKQTSVRDYVRNM